MFRIDCCKLLNLYQSFSVFEGGTMKQEETKKTMSEIAEEIMKEYKELFEELAK